MTVNTLFSTCENYFKHIYCLIDGSELYYYEDMYTFHYIYAYFKVINFMVYEDDDQDSVLVISII